MSKKVWVIEDHQEKPVFKTQKSERVISTALHKNVKQMNPALAYSLSLLIWGSGQFYNRQWKLGILFILLMINFYLIMSIVIMYWEPIKTSCGPLCDNNSGILITCVSFYLSGFIIWHFNALQAYFKTNKINAQSFKGIKIRLLPVICSFLMPGWGQFLNGQTKKGLLFQTFALAGLAAFPTILIIFLFWPILEASRTRIILEWMFTISIFLTPLILMMWLFSIFDAAKVTINDIKKEHLLKRIKYAINKFRHRIQLYGWKNAVISYIKRTIRISLFLILFVISYHFFPTNYYIHQLQNLGNHMSQKEMTVIPNLIKLLPPAGWE
jgi:hypothetical protein